MTPQEKAARAAFIEGSINEQWEGRIRHLYADVKGYVTIGVGNLVTLEGAMSLPLMRPDGSHATRGEIASEWLRLSKNPEAMRHGWQYAARITTLRLDQEDIDALVAARYDADHELLCQRFKALPEAPADAIFALHSMTWALGGGRLLGLFPRFVAAVDACDWLAASRECRMTERDNPGVTPRNVANRTMLVNAAITRDPCNLHYPRDLAKDFAPGDVSLEAPTVPSFDIVHPDVINPGKGE